MHGPPVPLQPNEDVISPLSGVMAWRHAPRRFADAVTRVLGVGAVHPSADPQIRSAGLIWPQWLAINAAFALFLTAVAANGSREGAAWAVPLLFFAIGMLFLPIATRLMLENVSRSERIANVMVAALGLFMLHVIRAPVSFISFDEFLHWVGAQQMVETGRLFTPNGLLPVATFYPGLEITTTAFHSLSGLPLFVCAVTVLMVARMLCIGALFLFYERVGGSARFAALACIFYMGSTTFVFFDTAFSYGSLAVALLTFSLLLDFRVGETGANWLARMAMFMLAVCALAMTHHMTSYGLSGFLAGFLVVEMIRRGPKDAALLKLAATTVCAFLIPFMWSRAMGNPGSGYLGPVFQQGVKEAIELVTNWGSSGRPLFTGDDGRSAMPLWQRIITLGAVALICAGLALGFFRSLSWSGMFARRSNTSAGWASALEWTNSRLVLLTLVTFFYPISMLCRLIRSAWEIGNRIGPFAFIGVGAVLSVCVISLLQGKSKSLWRASAIGAAATVMLMGGILSSEGPSVLVPAKFQVSADEASIEPMGVNAALWTKQWLGEGNRFGADRISRVLLAGYGGQLVSTTLQHHYDVGIALVSPTLGPEELNVITSLGIDYLFADLRLTTGRAVYGSYFDSSQADDMLDGPPEPEAMLKFNSIRGVNRIFDNGYSIIYDVKALNGGPHITSKPPESAPPGRVPGVAAPLFEWGQGAIKFAGAFLLLFVFPGFLMLRIWEPRQKFGFEGAVVALGLSVAAAIALGLALHPFAALTPLGWILTLGALCLAGWRHLWRRAAIQAAANGAEPAAVPPAWINAGQCARLAGAALLVVAAIALAREGAFSHKQFSYTEFWLLPSDGRTHQKITIGIKNEEKRQMTYQLELTLNGAVIKRSSHLVLEHDEQRVEQLTVPVGATGSEQRLEARLYVNDRDHPVLYRRAFLSNPAPNAPF